MINDDNMPTTASRMIIFYFGSHKYITFKPTQLENPKDDKQEELLRPNQRPQEDEASDVVGLPQSGHRRQRLPLTWIVLTGPSPNR